MMIIYTELVGLMITTILNSNDDMIHFDWTTPRCLGLSGVLGLLCVVRARPRMVVESYVLGFCMRA